MKQTNIAILVTNSIWSCSSDGSTTPASEQDSPSNRRPQASQSVLKAVRLGRRCSIGSALVSFYSPLPKSYTEAINKPSNIIRKVYTFKHTELHSSSLKDTKNSTNLVIREPLANAITLPFSLIFTGNITSSRA